MSLDDRKPPGVDFGEALRFWVKLGFINFGGPAGQIAIMHRELVERRQWVSEAQFLRALNFCALLPGPEAQQLATYIGWRLHGTVGGIAAGSFFVLPSIFVLLALSWLAVAQAHVPVVAGLLYGVQPVVIGIVLEAVLRIGRRALHHSALVAFAAAAFVALRFLSAPFPLVIAAAALCAVVLHRRWPGIFEPRGHRPAFLSEQGDAGHALAPPSYPPLLRALKLGVIFCLLWAIPIGGLWLWRGGTDVLTQQALFFTQAAFITFGGAYAVLSYIADVAVNHYGWLDASQMVQGLGLAESTPGPLIMVTQYVGFLGAWKFHGEFDPLLYGVLGALTTTYVTFLPCFLFIFVGAPYIEALARNRGLQAALVGVTSAVVGVILNLAVFFAGGVMFPNGGAVDGFAAVMAVVSFVLLRQTRVPIHALVPVGSAVGMVWKLLNASLAST